MHTKHSTVELSRAEELLESIIEELHEDIQDLITLDLDQPGITIPDALLLQHIPWEYQMEIWELVKDQKVLVIRLRVIHRILIRMKIEVCPIKGPISFPDELRIPSEDEVQQIIDTAI
ncbi:MAG: hypothetical protein JWP09_779 [Candidatus Taylorbacteria bacterium]|nr:hypothetical protein [Candidatus Taylorbacteria bacterium]